MSDFELSYPKIPGPFRRIAEGNQRGQIVWGMWTSQQLAYLHRNLWRFTEKIDGTNTRVQWADGKVKFAGRTSRSQMPPALLDHLDRTFPTQKLEAAFPAAPVTLFGEGIGGRIQKNAQRYSETETFVLFDVVVDGMWLDFDDVTGIADKLDIPSVPLVLTGTVHEALAAVHKGLTSAWGDFTAEGLVGRPRTLLYDRHGCPITVKVKTCDYGPGKLSDDEVTLLARVLS